MKIRPAMGRKGIIRCKSHLYKHSKSGIIPIFSSKNLVLSGILQMQIWYFGTLWTWQPCTVCKWDIILIETENMVDEEERIRRLWNTTNLQVAMSCTQNQFFKEISKSLKLYDIMKFLWHLKNAHEISIILWNLENPQKILKIWWNLENDVIKSLKCYTTSFKLCQLH